MPKFQHYISPFFRLYSSKFNARRGAISGTCGTEGRATIGKLAKKKERAANLIINLMDS